MLIVLADAIDLPQEQRLSGRRLAGNARSGLSTDCISWDKSLAGNKTCIRIVCDSVIALSQLLRVLSSYLLSYLLGDLIF
jgi:hypothetical protein